MTGVIDARMDAHEQAGDEVEGKEVLESVHLSDVAFSQFCHVFVGGYYFMVESGKFLRIEEKCLLHPYKCLAERTIRVFEKPDTFNAKKV